MYKSVLFCTKQKRYRRWINQSQLSIETITFYRPQTKLREGNVFTSVCHSVHRGAGRLHPEGIHHPLEVWTPSPPPPPPTGQRGGRYISYWNVSLFLIHTHKFDLQASSNVWFILFLELNPICRPTLIDNNINRPIYLNNFRVEEWHLKKENLASGSMRRSRNLFRLQASSVLALMGIGTTSLTSYQSILEDQ